MIDRRAAGFLAIASGGLIAFAMPPWGWWPCAFIGVALLDRLLAGQPRKTRFVRGTLVGMWWLFPATLWMWDLSPPGYVIQGLMFGALYGAVCMLVPADDGRRIALPAALVLAALVRWNWPWGGVPLATLAMSQADAPLVGTARVFGSLLIVALVGVGGVALSAAVSRRWAEAGIAVGLVVVAWGIAQVAPDGTPIDEIDVALVQGGGPQNTRALTSNSRKVFERHMAASEDIVGPVDFVLWPENVVHVRGDVEETVEYEELVDLARRVDAPVIAGIVETFRSEGFFLNASITITPNGEVVSRYDKVRRVPFGEFVPFRSLIEAFAPDFLSVTDARSGTEPGLIETGVGRAGIAISWEIFHDDRGYSGISRDGLILLNPTNGSSFWLTIVQTQQIASSQLRAIETGRYVLQAAPTGFSAIIEPDGTVIDRSGVSEAKVIQGTVELREGSTWATSLGVWPMLLITLALFTAAWRPARTGRRGESRSDLDRQGDGAVVDELDRHVGAEPPGRDGNVQLTE